MSHCKYWFSIFVSIHTVFSLELIIVLQALSDICANNTQLMILHISVKLFILSFWRYSGHHFSLNLLADSVWTLSNTCHAWWDFSAKSSRSSPLGWHLFMSKKYCIQRSLADNGCLQGWKHTQQKCHDIIKAVFHQALSYLPTEHWLIWKTVWQETAE